MPETPPAPVQPWIEPKAMQEWKGKHACWVLLTFHGASGWTLPLIIRLTALSSCIMNLTPHGL